MSGRISSKPANSNRFVLRDIQELRAKETAEAPVMMNVFTCKEFLQEVADYLDFTADAELRRELEAHISECSRCYVILDTTQKTIKLYKGIQPQEVPKVVQFRLMRAVERMMAAKPR